MSGPCETQFAIRGVFNQINRMSGRALEFFQQFQNAAFFLEAGGDTGRILKIADEVKRLDAAEFAGFFQPLQNGFEMGEVKSVAFEPDAARAEAAALEDAQEHEIRRVFDEHDVAFVAERLERSCKAVAASRR